MAEPEAPGHFDYLGSDSAQEVDTEADLADVGTDTEFDDEADVRAGTEADSFDAFDSTTWNFNLTPVPWYRTRRAAVVLGAAAVAAAAIVVSLVLLAVRNPSSGVDRAPTTVQTTASSPTASPAPPPPSPQETGVPPVPPAPPPPPPGAPPEPVPPPEPAAPPQDQSPVYQPTQRPTPTKRPEYNVTRAPISVAPQPRHPPK